MATKTLIVLGGTGGQGGSVINSFLSNPAWKIRTLTRDATSKSSKALSEKGVEVVQGNLGDKASLTAAFQGATAIYAVTDFWEPFATHSAEDAEALEIIQGKNIVDAASAVPTLQHFVWSTLQYTAEASSSAIHVPHFDGKTVIDEYIRSSPLKDRVTYLWVAFYTQNFHWGPLLPTKLIQGGKTTYTHLLSAAPHTPVPFVDHSTTVGPTVSAIITQPEKTIGRYVWATNGEVYTLKEMFTLWAEAAGVKDVKYIEVMDEAYETLYGKLGVELGLMWRFMERFGMTAGDKDVLYPGDLGVTGLVTLKEYLTGQDWSKYL